MFARFESAPELFTYKLGSALEMEQTVLKMLGRLEDEAQSDEIKQMLHHHAGETEQQVRNIEQAFSALGEDADDKPCPAMEAIAQQGRADVARTDDALVDSVILAGAGETEHYEIAVYEWLITEAEAMGKTDIVGLLQQNMEQEQHALEEVKRANRAVAGRTVQV
jgi:ferritin-like metal-binding protein YciE